MSNCSLSISSNVAAVASTIKLEVRDCVIKDVNGNEVFRSRGEVPADWTTLASDTAISKYFRKAGVTADGGGETSILQVVDRIVGSLSNYMVEHGYLADLHDQDIYEYDLAGILLRQEAAFNSPVWFNVGVYDAYAIKGSTGGYYYNEETKKVEKSEGSYVHPQASACFINSVQDDMDSIMELAKNQAHLYKHGSGTGTNYSTIRAKGEKLSCGGTSSGVMSFLDVYNAVAGAVKSGGSARRAASMICLDVDHPEIIDFIDWKVREEKKARALIDAGYPSDFNGEAYKTVGGQNSNNSVRLSDEFMLAVEEDANWNTINRTDGKVAQTHKARFIWDKIVKAAWQCADPAVQFDTTFNTWHTCKNAGKINSSNPCGEFAHVDDTACNLASINLKKFITKGGVDFKKLDRCIEILIMSQDALVGMSAYPTAKIAKNSHDLRPLGIGHTNLGGLLMSLGLPYDSEKARLLASAITSYLTSTAYEVSNKLAGIKGTFAEYKHNRDSFSKVMNLHHEAVCNLMYQGEGHFSNEDAGAKLIHGSYAKWTLIKEEAARGTRGFRNSQVSVCAPTGTIGLLMDCDTTGVEPDFSLIKFKKLVGGGYLKIVNNSVREGLTSCGYSPEEVDSLEAYVNEHGHLEGSGIKEEHLPIFDCANRCPGGTRFISPYAHILMMSTIQPFLSGAISKTVNLPNDATEEDISRIYMQSWKLGLKSVALYRDGCKGSQPLNSKDDSKKDEETPKGATPTSAVSEGLKGMPRGTKEKLPARRTGFTQEARVGGHKIFLRTGEYEDGRLGEIFLDLHKEGATFRSVMNCLAMSVSIGLQHGVPLQKYVDQYTYTRFEPQGIVEGHANIKFCTSILDYVFRVLGVEYLKQYELAQVPPVENESAPVLMAPPAERPSVKPMDATDNAASLLSNHLSEMMGDAPVCDVCGNVTVRNGSCYKCLNCGSSLGCS